MEVARITSLYYYAFLWCYIFLIRQATTKGIWAAICNDPRAIVLDIEGSDGQEHQVCLPLF